VTGCSGYKDKFILSMRGLLFKIRKRLQSLFFKELKNNFDLAEKNMHLFRTINPKQQ
jgi:hypothetical protein